MREVPGSEARVLRVFDPPAGVRHGYSARNGGASDEPYRSLNLGDHVGDDPARVRENRERFSRTVGVSPRWVTAEQTHGSQVAVVSEADAGRKISGVDALVTRTPNLPLALFFADCASLLFYDPVHRAVGVAHAGWRGTAAEIGLRTLAALGAAFGSRPEEIWTGIGPSIGACCYEVGPEVAESLGRWDGAIHEREGRRFADIVAANRAQLIGGGVDPAKLNTLHCCTCCASEAFFSYRREGTTGRMGAVLCLAG